MKKQSIGCSVSACKHNCGCTCGLEHIDVCSCCDCADCKEDESMCDSFEPKK